MKHILTNALCWLLALSATASDTIEPGQFYTEPPTFHSLGFQWNMSGDENRDAQVAVAFREEGASEWRHALNLLRIKSEVVGSNVPEKQYTCGNLFAGSILFLESGMGYEVSLSLSDPDKHRRNVRGVNQS